MNRAAFWDLQGGEATGKYCGICLLCVCTGGAALHRVQYHHHKPGLFQEKVYRREEERILCLFGAHGRLIEEMPCCLHTSADGCSCKRPQTGLIDRCMEKYGLEREKCAVVGDMGKNEILLARNAGCPGVLVRTGGGEDSLGRFRYTWAGAEAYIIARDALEAVQEIAVWAGGH